MATLSCIQNFPNVFLLKGKNPHTTKSIIMVNRAAQQLVSIFYGSLPFLIYSSDIGCLLLLQHSGQTPLQGTCTSRLLVFRMSMCHPFASFRSQLKCYLFCDAFSAPTFKCLSLTSLSIPFLHFHFSSKNFSKSVYILLSTMFIACLPSLEYKFHEDRHIGLFVAL